MYGDEGDDTSFSESKTRITAQQKLKFILHWALIIVVHVMIFWYFPISGNKTLYKGQPYCEPKETQQYPYGCKNFHDNTSLVVFYFLFCCYFTLSALQLRYGLPIMKKPSSTMQYYDTNTLSGNLGFIGAQVYVAIPFAIELRCLLDFCLTKTALDIFQFWQLFNYHMDLYVAMMGNESYVNKVMGVRTTWDNYCLGWVILTVLLLIVVGPFAFFSEIGGFIQFNEVQSAKINVAVLVNKTLSLKNLTDRGVPPMEQKGHKKKGATTAMTADAAFAGPGQSSIGLDQLYSQSSSKGQPMSEMPSEEGTNMFASAKHKKLFETRDLQTCVPFDIWAVDNPNMRNISKAYFEA